MSFHKNHFYSILYKRLVSFIFLFLQKHKSMTSIIKKSIVAVCALCFLMACKQEKTIHFQGFAIGTYYSITYIGKENADLPRAIDSILNDISKTFSIFDTTSVISKVNTNERVALNQDFISIFNTASELSELTDGAFDATVAPLVNVWGFGMEKQLKITQEEIDSLLTFVGYKKVSLQKQEIFKSDPRIQLNFNAIAKGYVVDKISDFLVAQGYSDCLVDIGGEVVARGTKNGKDWQIGIQIPTETAEGEMAADYVFALQNRAVATSGNYRQYHEENGQRFSHIINPKTGQSERSNLLSVTVIAANCTYADALATAFMVMGLDASMQFLDKHTQYAAYFIYDDKGKFRTQKTKNFPEKP
jgi:thiamine biosynthesis lipoprotein